MQSNSQPSDASYQEREKATERVCRICQSLAYYARRLAGRNENDAEDLLQESLTRVLKKKSLDWLLTEREQAIESYIKKTLLNTFIEIDRRAKNFKNIKDKIIINTSSIEDYDPSHTKSLSAAIEEAIPDERRREIFVREHLYRESIGTIAERLGVDRTTIWRVKQEEDRSDDKLLARIRRILERDGHDYDSFYQIHAVEPRRPLTTEHSQGDG